MGERKVLNKYYPIDFDPSIIPRRRMAKNRQYVVRMELPMNVKCDRCGEFIYQGKRFNARKEEVRGEDYLGIKIFRFYLRCVRCSGEFTIKTDPENFDYTCEHGVTRNFEPWREEKEFALEEKRRRQEIENGDTIAQLEHKTIDSKKEVQDLEILDEIRAINAKNNKLEPEQVMKQYVKKRNAEALLSGLMIPEGDEEDDVSGGGGGGDVDEDGAPLLPEEQLELEAFREAKLFRRLDDDKDATPAVAAAPTVFQNFPVVKKPNSASEVAGRGGAGRGRGGRGGLVIVKKKVSTTPAATTASSSATTSPASTTASSPSVANVPQQ
eukprot:c1553_g1_i1.p1 GENE.c1553_g1_i1~~c1553_g1_i1.p1  ORF type:complete len:344 (+),score=97.76 c1553_g1_i1:58-1032(+)